MWSPRDDDHPRIAVNFFVVEKIAIMRQQHAVLAPSISVHFSVVAASEADVAHKEMRCSAAGGGTARPRCRHLRQPENVSCVGTWHRGEVDLGADATASK